MQLSSEEAHWRGIARQFADEIKPTVNSFERKSEFPLQAMKELGKKGVLGVSFPREYGGEGKGSFCIVLCIQEISKVWASLGLSIGAHLLGTNPILFAGNESQKKKYLPPLIKGESLGSFGLTEPSSGSDAGSSQTTAARSGNHYIINGKKIFTTSATRASTTIVSAVTDKAKEKKGITAFIVERTFPGLSTSKKENKLGLWASDTSGLILDNCQVPIENMLGEEGEGFKVFLQTLDAGRLGIAGWCLGIAEAAFGELLDWAKKVEMKDHLMNQFEFQAGTLARISTGLEASGLLLQEACRLKDAGLSYTKLASMAKLSASTLAEEASDAALRIIGYEALTDRTPVERYFRDAKLGTIGEGTSEIQQLVIAREVLSESNARLAPC